MRAPNGAQKNRDPGRISEGRPFGEAEGLYAIAFCCKILRILACLQAERRRKMRGIDDLDLRFYATLFFLFPSDTG
jgi:hypothetical protein